MKRTTQKRLTLNRVTVAALGKAHGGLRMVDSYGEYCSNSCNTCRETDCCVDVPDSALLAYLTSSACPEGFTNYCVA